jgi:hypothetical protein
VKLLPVLGLSRWQLLHFLNNKENNSPKQETLVFLETTVHRVGEKAKKTNEKLGINPIKPSVLVEFLSPKNDCAYTSAF